jgi:hypothetical protein
MPHYKSSAKMKVTATRTKVKGKKVKDPNAPLFKAGFMFTPKRK